MKVGWEKKTLGEVCRLINGRAYKKSELLRKGKYPVLRVGNFFTNQFWYYSDLELDEDKYCDDGDLLYAWSASFGPRVWFGGKVIYHYHIWKTDLDCSKVDKKFLYHWFDWDKEKIKSEQGAGTTMIHVTKGSMEQRSLLLPPLPEQQRIVTILDQAFGAIATAKANAEKNLKNAREIFESHLNAVFTQPGEGWSNVLLADICDVRDGTHDSPKYVDDGIPFVTQKNIRDDGLCFEKIKFISGSDHEKFYKRSNVSEGDILISMIGVNRGMACLVDDSRTFSIKNVGLIKLSKKIDMSFLLCYLKSNLAKNYVEAESRGGAQPFIGLKKLREFPVAIAPSTVQISVVQQVEELQLQTQRLESIYQQKLNALDELKKSLLHQAFTGELTAMPDKQLDEALT